MAPWLIAGLGGALAGGALLIGAAIAWFIDVPRSVVSAVMGFGAGVLVAALTFELFAEATETGGLLVSCIGFAIGAVVYVGANLVLNAAGARHRKRSDPKFHDAGTGGGGTAIAVGALLDGIPESVVLGISVLSGGALSLPILGAIFISNLPEGLSSTAGMKHSGRSAKYVFGVWSVIAIACGISALLGCTLLGGAPLGVVAFVNALAAGAILAMISDTMLPEAFDEAQLYTGLITTMGFLCAFVLHALG